MRKSSANRAKNKGFNGGQLPASMPWERFAGVEKRKDAASVAKRNAKRAPGDRSAVGSVDSEIHAQISVFADTSTALSALNDEGITPNRFQKEQLEKGPQFCERWSTSHGFFAVCVAVKADFGTLRDRIGSLFMQLKSAKVRQFSLTADGLNNEQEIAVLLGAQLAVYGFYDLQLKARTSRISVQGFSDEAIAEAEHRARAVNATRHLVNLPSGSLSTASYANIVESHFKTFKSMQVEIWDEERLEKEGMGLHYAVGHAAEHGSHLVHLRYRPKASGEKGKGSQARDPIAFVGKGVVFDTGGLDIKPAAGMRYMKKDMAGSATLVGLAHYLAATNHPQPCDFYLALAENAISARSFRPGDILIARNGKSVEIHNTDAEGRLVMADSLALATESKGADEPQLIIDVSTLTGAMRVAVGPDLIGYFSNRDEIATKFMTAATSVGDPAWRLPLHRPYESYLKSTVADLSNASNAPFAGAISAALFLEKFVGDTPWLHIDMYGWTEKATGALTEAGASGQTVQALIEFLRTN